MRVASLLLAILLAGCSANANVRLGSGAPAASGTSTASSSVGAQVRFGSVAGTLIGFGILVAAWHGADGYAYPALESQLDESRRVNEQDCTRPIEDWSANLKCK